ncbi:cytochrome P450 [Kribbella orskensis]|uniref:Cytochrome P450 n=1 Tax=Kribbella orskensis TaxID=2512216 RepID=A0ABY2BHY3_9ACTN|nr:MULTISPECIES: cytochrome P450 [Kribbella]TCN38738.1 cytochrome P450 [Kribbella sp. VKM Ac-2500]TCO20919.1 cytochrome P450 [Kribbella orskensis]
MTADELLAELQTDDGRRAPYPLYARLHELGPVNLTPASPAYAAVANGYAAVDQILRDPRFVKGGPPPAADADPITTALSNSMMFRTEPDHGRMRKAFHQAFTPRRVAALEPQITALTDSLLDRLASLGADCPVDFIAEFGYLLPAGVMSALLGIPSPDLDWFRTRVQRVEDYLDFGGRTPEKVAAANEAATEMSAYYAALIAERRVSPGDDLISGLVQVIDAGEGELTDEELIGNLLVLFNASFVTTINLLGNALPPLLERPALVKSLATDPAVAEVCVEEVLRYDGTAQLVVRTASEDLEVGGVVIPRGGLVLVILGAANRDPARFPSPEVFDPERPDKRHITFGAGAYFCIGAVLARAEGRLALPRLFQRFPDLALAEPPVQSAGLALRGFATMPVSLGL